eukprot:TRINITY_DN3184_c0_g1_i1.p1 TRINITY_DN3184_c0_g1~~TRINITY_DN3184_c0_g1_i1.p1  ORF type:complete len:271 (-),score=71.29 TRINITY_DN3184_c0_g1_i1:182-994(-)
MSEFGGSGHKLDDEASETLQQHTWLKCGDCDKIISRTERDIALHVQKTGHSNFEEYEPKEGDKPVEEVSLLTDEERQRKVEEYRVMLKNRKAAQVEEEEKEHSRKELERREQSKVSREVREELEAARKKREEECAKRVRQQEREHQEAVKRKAEELRRARGDNQAVAQKMESQPPIPTTGTTQAQPSKPMDTCQLQIRQPNGTKLIETFKSSDTVRVVVDYISKNRTDGKTTKFFLSSTYPKKDFTDGQLNITLLDAGLVPRSALIMNYC